MPVSFFRYVWKEGGGQKKTLWGKKDKKKMDLLPPEDDLRDASLWLI